MTGVLLSVDDQPDARLVPHLLEPACSGLLDPEQATGGWPR